MDISLDALKDCELIVRKKVAGIIEKLLRCTGYDFRHDTYKQIVYGEISYNTPFEEKFKNYYDAFMYLLANRSNPLTKELLEKFFYIINYKNIDQYLLLRITSYSFYSEKDKLVKELVKFHMHIYNEFNFLDDDERLIISWIFLNYYLVKNNIPCVPLLRTDYKKYINLRCDYLQGKTKALEDFICEIISKAKFQTVEFRQNLRVLETNEIIEIIKAEEITLRENYKIIKVFLFGSFAKGLARIDSDIDLMVMFSEDVCYEEKVRTIKELNIYYEKKFSRYIDISEISTYLTDDFLKEHTRIIKIY